MDVGHERGMRSRRGIGDSATLTRVKDTAHGTNAGWHTGCRCDLCRRGRVTTRELADEPERRSGYQLRCGDSYST